MKPATSVQASDDPPYQMDSSDNGKWPLMRSCDDVNNSSQIVTATHSL